MSLPPGPMPGRLPAPGGRRHGRRLRTPLDIDRAGESGFTAWVPELMRCLGSDDAMARSSAGQALLKMGDAGFLALLRAASHGSRRQRLEAVELLGRFNDVRALHPLLDALKHDKVDRSAGAIIEGLWILVWSLLQSQRSFYAERVISDYSPNMPSAHDTALRSCAARALGNLGDVRATLPLVALLQDQDREVQRAAWQGLAQLLPLVAQLTPEQAGRLGTGAAARLAAMLAGADAVVATALLPAIAAIGDRSVLPAVQRLSLEAASQPVREQAFYVLRVVEARLALMVERSTLLRGAGAPSTLAPETLLRPAGVGAETHPRELLRGAEPEQTSGV